MKSLTTVALLLALFCAPSLAQAEATAVSRPAVSGSPSGRSIEPAPQTLELMALPPWPGTCSTSQPRFDNRMTG